MLNFFFFAFVKIGDDTPCFNDLSNFVNQRTQQEGPWVLHLILLMLHLKHGLVFLAGYGSTRALLHTLLIFLPW